MCGKNREIISTLRNSTKEWIGDGGKTEKGTVRVGWVKVKVVESEEGRNQVREVG